MVDKSGGNKLTDKHKEYRVSNTKRRSDPSDGQNIEGDEKPRQIQVDGCPRQVSKAATCAERHQYRCKESDGEQDQRRGRRRPKSLTKCGVQGRQQRHTEPGKQHDSRRAEVGHGIDLLFRVPHLQPCPISPMPASKSNQRT